MKLSEQCEDSVVEERLLHVVDHAFTVLQSLCNQNGEHATASITPRFVACAALFLHLQDYHYTQKVDDWQPFHVQHRSSRASQSTGRLKRYVTSEQLGEDINSPLTQFPRCCEHLTSTLNPEVHAIATPPMLCWLRGAGFVSTHALFRHTRTAHGDYAEYRKHLFWLAQELGFLPLPPWQKRHMLANFSFFQCFSTPESGAMGWSEGKSPTTAERRQEMGCAICARKDWLEHCYRVYLWREPEEACAANDPKPEVVLQTHLPWKNWEALRRPIMTCPAADLTIVC